LKTVQPEQQPQDAAPDRLVRVAPERLARWLAGFEDRHGSVQAGASGDEVTLVAADGAQARILVPFPPLVGDDPLHDLVRHAGVERRVGALLVRKGGYAVGLFAGRRLVESKAGSPYVQGRSKAGGWSQQRFARRRENQAGKAFEAAVQAAAAILLPVVDDLEWVFLGGDRAALDAVLGEARLAAVRAKAGNRIWPAAEPRRRVLEAFPDQFLAVEIRLNHLA
jgi:Actinobacteria/chloroflexi VLRF1 release factor